MREEHGTEKMQGLRDLEIRSLLQRIPETRRVPVRVIEERPPSNQQTIITVPALEAFLARVRESGMYAIDVETTSIDPMKAKLVGISISVSPHESAYIPVGHIGADQLSFDEIAERLRPVLRVLQRMARSSAY